MFSCFLHQFALMAELGTSLFQIAQSLIALEGLLISGAKEDFNKISNWVVASWKNPILSGWLMSDLRNK